MGLFTIKSSSLFPPQMLHPCLPPTHHPRISTSLILRVAVLSVQRVEDVALEAPQASHFSREIMKCDRTRLCTFLSLSSRGSSRRRHRAFPVGRLRQKLQTTQRAHTAKAKTAVALTSASLKIPWLAAVSGSTKSIISVISKPFLSFLHLGIHKSKLFSFYSCKMQNLAPR